METLRRQSGTTRVLKLFAYDIRKIAETQPLPEYGLRIGRDGKSRARHPLSRSQQAREDEAGLPAGGDRSPP